MSGFKKIMVTVLLVLALLILFLVLPFSILRRKFHNDYTKKIKEYDNSSRIITKKDISKLPMQIQKHLEYCGFLNKKRAVYMNIKFSNVSFQMDQNRPPLEMDYEQYNFSGNKMERIALIKASMFGIPFEGYDSYKNGIGIMEGRLAKIIPLFSQTGSNMDSASLVTMLAESIFFPAFLLEQNMEWAVVSDSEVKATLHYNGLAVSGVFRFGENGEMTEFETNDRISTSFDGEQKKATWLTKAFDYENKNGFNLPSRLQAIWKYPNEDLIYFDGSTIEYSYGNN